MAFLDLMAYTRGQQEAQNDNWRDVFNDARASQMQQALDQNQLNFDLEFPLRQLAAEDTLNAGQGKRALSNLFTQYDTRIGDIPQDMRADYTVDWLTRVRQGIDPNAPGAATTLAGLNDRSRAWMLEFARAGNSDAAARIAQTMAGPGADVGNQIQNITAWNNPTGEMIRAAGGIVDDNNPGVVTYNGLQIPAQRFYALQQQLAANPMSGVYANGMAREQTIFDAQQRQQQMLGQQRTAAMRTQEQLRALGYDSVIGANGQVIPVGRSATTTTGTALPGAAPMNPQAPGFQVDPSYGATLQNNLGLPNVAMADAVPAAPSTPTAVSTTPALPVVPQVPRDMSGVPAMGTVTQAQRLAALRQSATQQQQAQAAANTQAATQYAATVLANRDMRGAFQLQSDWTLFNALPDQTKFQIYALVNGITPVNTGGASGDF